jgi:serine/threonine-protein kinase HipA
VAKSIRDYVSGDRLMEARERFFAALVLSVMVRNGNAHLKNFGVLYARPGDAVELAPVYDIVTTTAYIINDVPALTLAGAKKWWPRKVLERFAVAHLSLPVKKVSETFARAAEAVMETRGMIPAYISDHPEFLAVGERMMEQWEQGVRGLVG